MSAGSESASPVVWDEPRPCARLKRTAAALVVLGAVLSLLALRFAGPTRFGFAYLWGFAFVWSVVLGSLFFVGLQHVTHSVWSVVVRRTAEVLAAPMWLVAVLFVPILLFVLLPDSFHVYPWADPQTTQHERTVRVNTAYLNAPFFAVRSAAYLALWMAFARYFVSRSFRQDRGGRAEETTVRLRRASVPFMLVFAVTVTFAGIDWLMSLSPTWYSTMFGVYVFAGVATVSLAAVTAATVLLMRYGRLSTEVITRDHLYNLGALLFAFVCFWAYIAFSQYMLIWYANIPEESFYLVRRLQGGWLPVSVALGVVRFVVPFLALLPRRAKTNPRVLLAVSVLVLGGQFLDLYWLIMPEHDAAGPVLGWPELGPSLLMIGLLLLEVARLLGRYAPMPVGDPLLEDSRRFRL